MLGKDYKDQDCSLASALEVLGERWTLLIVRDAFFGVERFNHFQAHLDVPKAILAARLNGLVDSGVLEREPDPRHAGRSLYRLTEAGKQLWPALHALLVWGDRHRHPNSRYFTHALCGTKLNDSGTCPSCAVMIRPEEITSTPRRRIGARRTDPVAVALRKPRRLLDPIDA